MPSGSLQEATFGLLRKAGLEVSVAERSYAPRTSDRCLECVLLRAQEIPQYVETGRLDAGLSGRDWILETKANVQEVMDLNYSKTGAGKVKWVVAVPEASEVRSVNDLEGKRIATELVNVTRGYLRRKKVNAEVEFSWGATEGKAPLFVDAICELTETGASMKANGLRAIFTVIESTTRFIANKDSMADEWKNKKIRSMAALLRMAL